MSTNVLPFRRPKAAPHLRIVELAPWWTCPSFCEDCTGGEGFEFGDGNLQVTSRRHARTVYAATSSDDGVGNEVTARVEVYVREDPDHGWTDPPQIDVDVAAVLDHPAAVEFAQAVLTAVDIARRTLPTITRPASEGAGRASTLATA